MEYLTWLEVILRAFGAEIVMILGLVAADVLSGIGAALARKEFDWRRVADFYESNVIPKLIGWLALVVVSRTVVADLLPPDYSFLAPGVEYAGFAAVVIALGSSIVDNLRDIGVALKG
jgi:hypothetical protein